MKGKSEASQLVKIFSYQFNIKVKIIRSDNGSEFIIGPMKKFYREEGIINQTSCVDVTPLSLITLFEFR